MTLPRRTWIARLVGGLAFAVVLACMGLAFPLQGLFHLAIGWVRFPLRTLPLVAVRWNDVLLAAGTLVAFTAGLHYFLRWLRTASSASRAEAAGDSPDAARASVAPQEEAIDWPWRRTAQIVALVLLVFVAGTALIGIAHEFAWMVREPNWIGSSMRVASHRMSSGNNLKQFGLAAMLHGDRHGSLPVGTLRDSQGRPLHGWLTLLLPFAEQEPLFERIDLSKRWDDPAQGDAFRTRLPFAERPPRHLPGPVDSGDFARTDYSGNLRLLGVRAARRMADLASTSDTILCGEIEAAAPPWGRPGNLRDPALGIRPNDPRAFCGPYGDRKGAQFVMVDGSTHYLAADVDPQVLAQLATPKLAE